MYKFFKKIFISITILNCSILGCSLVGKQIPILPIIGTYCLLDSFGADTTNPGQYEYFINNAPLNKINRIYIAFADIQNNGVFGFKDKVKEFFFEKMINYYNHNGLKQKVEILISAGTNTSAEIDWVTGEKGVKLAKNIVDFINKYNLDGFDWDHEVGVSSETPEFLTYMRDAYKKYGLPNKKYYLTMVVQNDTSLYFSGAVMLGYVDQINIMSYGAFISLNDSITSWKDAGFLDEQMVGGLEVEYGYAKNQQDTTGPNGTIQQKCSLALQNKLAGMFSWRIDNDYKTTPNSNPSFAGSLDMWKYMTNVSKE